MDDNELSEQEIQNAANSPDNSYVGTEVVPPKADELDSNYAPLPFIEEDAALNFTFFKHKMVSRFEIPRGNSLQDSFKFANHIAKIRNEDVPEFIEACRGLHRADSGNIVQIKNIQNEVAIDVGRPQAFRQAASTHTIVAPTRDGPAGLEATATAQRDSSPPGTRQTPAPQRPTGLGALLRNNG